MDNNNNINSNEHKDNITYIPIDKYIYNDKKEIDETFDNKTISILELSATEITNSNNNNNNNNIVTIGVNAELPINNNSLPQYVELNILLITLLLFIDTLCILKYIYLPVVLYDFFGPLWIIFPWALTAAVNYFLQVLVIYSGENGR